MMEKEAVSERKKDATRQAQGWGGSWGVLLNQSSRWGKSQRVLILSSIKKKKESKKEGKGRGIPGFWKKPVQCHPSCADG
jgi:hypothetical protein